MNYNFKLARKVTAILTVVFMVVSIAMMIMKMQEAGFFIMASAVFFMFYLIINGIDKYGL